MRTEEAVYKTRYRTGAVTRRNGKVNGKCIGLFLREMCSKV